MRATDFNKLKDCYRELDHFLLKQSMLKSLQFALKTNKKFPKY